jgi:ABC-type transport system involved in multi-copper enzyme maturation permease subunit
MWPIIKKELRENTPYLLGAFVIFLLILDFGAFDRGWILLGCPMVLDGQHASWQNTTYYAADAGMEGSWNSACLLLAGAIAWGQVYQERRRKTWPLLVHLPISRSGIIFAKVLAGLLMYLIVCFPLAFLIIARLNTPGVWPGPIYAYMFFPLLTYFLAGAMFYLTAFLSAFRSARWYATKWLPLMAAIPVFIVAECLNRPFFFWEVSTGTPYMSLTVLVLAPLSLVFVIWAIRGQARAREY